MRPQQKTNEEIIDIARQIFITNGPQASVEDIAKVVGLSQPALFKRFGTKRNLLLQTLKPSSDVPWYKTVENGPDERPFLEQLTVIALEVHEWFSKLAPLLFAVKFSGIPPMEFLEDEKELIPVTAVRLLSEWLQRCYDKGLIRKTDYKIAAKTILGFIHSDTTMATMMELRKEEVSDVEVSKCIDFIWHGLKPDK